MFEVKDFTYFYKLALFVDVLIISGVNTLPNAINMYYNANYHIIEFFKI